MIGFFFTNEPVINYETAKASDLKLFANYYKGMANEGVFLPPSQFEGLFLSTAHTEEDIEKQSVQLRKYLLRSAADKSENRYQGHPCTGFSVLAHS